MYSSLLCAIGAAAVVGSSIVLADANPDSESLAVLQSKFFVEDEVNLGIEGDLQEEDQNAAESLEINATNNVDIESGEMWEDTLSRQGEAEENLEAESADTSVVLTDEELKLLAEGELFEEGQIVEDAHKPQGNYQPVGYGYCRDSNGRNTLKVISQQNKGVSQHHCKKKCDEDPRCTGIDTAMHQTDGHCILRTGDVGSGSDGWHSNHNSPCMKKVTQATYYKTVGYGYCRDTNGRNTLKVIRQWNNWISQALCKKKCGEDSRCTGIDTHRHSGHCILRTGAVGTGSNGLHSNHNSPCMKKVTM